MATPKQGNTNPVPNEKEYLNIIELLECDQPYKEIDRLRDPILENIPDKDKLRRIQGSLVGLAIGDALGAPVEFRPHSYLQENEVKDFQSGGTWGLPAGHWTDDTSMALCLAASLIVRGKFDDYDQFDRYRRWYKMGYMSSTGTCFDIGKSTRDAIESFYLCQRRISQDLKGNNPDAPRDKNLLDKIKKEYKVRYPNLQHASPDSAGNGALMRVAPLPAFFHNSYDDLMKCIDKATTLTHCDPRAIDACRFYAVLIWDAIHGKEKKDLLGREFYKTHKLKLHKEVREIAEGSYRLKGGYDDGIRGKGFVLDSLRAALWAFCYDDNNFEKGVLLAINLGDDTDTTAAIYGQLAGAVYGIDKIKQDWQERLFAGKFIMNVATALLVKGTPYTSRSDWPDEDAPSTDNNASASTNQANKNKTFDKKQPQDKGNKAQQPSSTIAKQPPKQDNDGASSAKNNVASQPNVLSEV